MTDFGLETIRLKISKGDNLISPLVGSDTMINLGLGLLSSTVLYGRGGFSPASLFSSGEQGAWYDPSDFSTMFQDAAGTTPVTAVEQPVGLLLDKSKGLALGSDGISGSYTGTATGVWAITATTVTRSGIAGSAIVNLPGIAALDANKTYLVSFTVAGLTGDSISFKLPSAGSNNDQISANGTYTYRVKAGGTTSEIQFIAWAGTTGTVTITNISVRELPGNHASQSTAASRPVLSARVNLLTYSEALSNAAWTSGAISNGSRTNGSVSVSTNEGYAYINTYVGALITAPTASYTISFDVTCDQTIANVPIRAAGNTSQYTLENLTAGITKRVSISSFVPTLASGVVSFGIDARDAVVPGGSNATGYIVTFDKIDLRVTNVGVNLPAYQRVGAATDYDTGFPLYLKFDGVDDSLATGTIDFSATDKMSVFAGVRKLSDATQQFLLEFGPTSDVTNRTFGLQAFTDQKFYWQSRGTFISQTSSSSAAAPLTRVLAGIADISGDNCLLRVNAVAQTANTSDQGTVNYDNYPLYIGRRNNATLPFNGNLYSLIVRGALSTDAQIASTETYVNSKTRAY